jgi:hypothetical protein
MRFIRATYSRSSASYRPPPGDDEPQTIFDQRRESAPFGGGLALGAPQEVLGQANGPFRHVKNIS